MNFGKQQGFLDSPISYIHRCTSFYSCVGNGIVFSSGNGEKICVHGHGDLDGRCSAGVSMEVQGWQQII